MAFIPVAFKSDTFPPISLGSSLRGICEQYEILRLRIFDDVGATIIYFVPPGTMEVPSKL